jgi:hypothetical protein
MSAPDHFRRTWAIRVTSAYPQRAEVQRTSWPFAFVPRTVGQNSCRRVAPEDQTAIKHKSQNCNPMIGAAPIRVSLAEWDRPSTRRNMRGEKELVSSILSRPPQLRARRRKPFVEPTKSGLVAITRRYCTCGREIATSTSVVKASPSYGHQNSLPGGPAACPRHQVQDIASEKTARTQY